MKEKVSRLSMVSWLFNWQNVQNTLMLVIHGYDGANVHVILHAETGKVISYFEEVHFFKRIFIFNVY